MYAQFVTTDGRAFPLDESGIQYTRGLGMSPNFNTFRLIGDLTSVLPIGTVGALVLSSPEATIRIANEIIHETSLTKSVTGGTSTVVTIKDGRAAAQRGAIVGQFNIPLEGLEFGDRGQIVNGSLLKQTHIQDLVRKCFAAAGIPSADGTTIPAPDLSALDSMKSYYPAVRWEFNNPARSIEELLQQVSCAVAYTIDGRYRVVKIGNDEGAFFGGPFETVVNPKRTDTGLAQKVYVVGGRIIREDLATDLEPVGLDMDGKVKRLKDLSYAPDPTMDYGGFENIADTDAIAADPANAGAGADGVSLLRIPTHDPAYPPEAVEAVAKQTVWKWYAAALGSPERLPFQPRICHTEKTDGGPFPIVRMEPVVYVRRLNPETFVNDPTILVVTDQGMTAYSVRDGYDIDLERGIVRFTDPTFLAPEAGDTGACKPAEVHLRYAYEHSFPAPAGQVPGPAQIFEDDYYVYPTPPDDADGGIEPYADVIRRPELTLYVVKEFDEHAAARDVELNRDELDTFSQKLIDQNTAQGTFFVGGEGTVPRLVPFDCNGAFRQIQWSMSAGGGWSTSVTYNTESPMGRDRYLTYYEKLKLHTLTEIAGKVDKHNLKVKVNNAREHGHVTHGAGRAPISAHKIAKRPLRRPIYNGGDDEMPAGSLVQVTSILPNGVPVVEQCDSGDPNQLMVNACVLPAGASGIGLYAGQVRVQCDSSMSAGDTIGPASDQFEASKDAGSIRVVDVDPDDDTIAIVYLGAMGGGGAVPLIVTNADDSGTDFPYAYKVKKIDPATNDGTGDEFDYHAYAEDDYPAAIKDSYDKHVVGDKILGWWEPLNNRYVTNVMRQYRGNPDCVGGG